MREKGERGTEGVREKVQVERRVERAFTKLVLPLSTWPNTPRLMLKVLLPLLALFALMFEFDCCSFFYCCSLEPLTCADPNHDNQS